MPLADSAAIAAQRQDAQRASSLLDAHARAHATPAELRTLDHVVDFNQAEADCPACGARFRTDRDRCPDCGLRFA